MTMMITLDFEKNVLYHFDFIGDKLKIGKFCAIAAKAKFIMNGANHNTNAFTTFPFGAFGGDWEVGLPNLSGATKGTLWLEMMFGLVTTLPLCPEFKLVMARSLRQTPW